VQVAVHDACRGVHVVLVDNHSHTSKFLPSQSTMSEYDQMDFEMLEDEEDSYDGPDAYVEGDDNVLELENLPESLQEHRGTPRESSSFSQILLCEFVHCRAHSAYAQLVRSVI
jgi:hypothetical protein